MKYAAAVVFAWLIVSVNLSAQTLLTEPVVDSGTLNGKFTLGGVTGTGFGTPGNQNAMLNIYDSRYGTRYNVLDVGQLTDTADPGFNLAAPRNAGRFQQSIIGPNPSGAATSLIAGMNLTTTATSTINKPELVMLHIGMQGAANANSVSVIRTSLDNSGNWTGHINEYNGFWVPQFEITEPGSGTIEYFNAFRVGNIAQYPGVLRPYSFVSEGKNVRQSFVGVTELGYAGASGRSGTLQFNGTASGNLMLSVTDDASALTADGVPGLNTTVTCPAGEAVKSITITAGLVTGVVCAVP